MTNVISFAKQNLANAVTILGVLPMFYLLNAENVQYLPLFIIYNNIMDDLDGILARELNIASKLGGNLDNLSDAISHIIILWVLLTQYSGYITIFGFLVTIALILRVAKRLDESIVIRGGSPTNELMRHIFLFYLLSENFAISSVWLVVIFIFHSLSLVAPFEMPGMVRSRASSVPEITFVNILLIIALVSSILPFVALLFFGAYLFSFSSNTLTWMKAYRLQTE